MKKTRRPLTLLEVRASIDAAKMRLDSALAAQDVGDAEALVRDAVAGLKSICWPSSTGVLCVTYHPSTRFPGEYWDVAHFGDGSVSVTAPVQDWRGRMKWETHPHPSFHDALRTHPDLRVEAEELRATFGVGQ